MKSIIIRQNGKVILHIKKTKTGVEARQLKELQVLDIKVITNNGSVINL